MTTESLDPRKFGMPAISKNISRVHYPGETGFGIVTYAPGGKLGPRRQQLLQLVVIHRGSLRLSVNGAEALTVRRGEGILLKPEDVDDFQFSVKTETLHSWAQIPTELLPGETHVPSQFFNRPGRCSSWLMDFLTTAWKLNFRPGWAGQKMLATSVTSVMWDFVAAFSDTAPHPPEALRKAESHIATHLGAPLALDEIVKEAGVSKGHFIKLARAHWGATPMDYVWQRRLREAASLLRATGLSISEIAYRTGFANPFHFSRKFRHRYGRSPRAWRQTEWRG